MAPTAMVQHLLPFLIAGCIGTTLANELANRKIPEVQAVLGGSGTPPESKLRPSARLGVPLLNPSTNSKTAPSDPQTPSINPLGCGSSITATPGQERHRTRYRRSKGRRHKSRSGFRLYSEKSSSKSEENRRTFGAGSDFKPKPGRKNPQELPEASGGSSWEDSGDASDKTSSPENKSEPKSKGHVYGVSGSDIHIISGSSDKRAKSSPSSGEPPLYFRTYRGRSRGRHDRRHDSVGWSDNSRQSY